MHRKTSNEPLRRTRLAMNLSLAEFAAAINEAGVRAGDELRCEARLVAKWEAGETRWPQGRYRRALEAVTGKPCAELGFRPGAGTSSVPPFDAAPTVDSRHELEDPLLRREFLASSAAG